MVHLQHFFSVHTPAVSVPTLSLINKRRIPISRFQLDGCDGDGELKKRGTNFQSHRAVERDSEFEVDPDKAREALRKLDQQLQSLSQKQINPPKIRASDLNRARDEMKEEVSKYSGSSLAYLAFGLLLFTIFYNVLFITVIKPSIDGP
ncbi:hypothetical protein F0562_001224 [Nyssa sinensis]|uniref:Uncharacterized protein n=1 Tax=Nyssa sinensis TaxID=561372 RepID=A0A5J5C395_9ASTE|nr:hypothetical protein F0562_001224 [Nyssa sinensis]